jgi:hypothetical protein
MQTDPGTVHINRSQTHECANWAEAAVFPDISGISVAV